MKLKILFLSANPHQDLSPDEEYRVIEDVVKKSNLREHVELVPKYAVRINDLILAINEENPHIIHFTGHGTQNGELRLTDESGNMDELFSKESLEKLFSTIHGTKLFFLSACHSEIQAKVITSYIDYVLGMKGKINDNTAIAFTETFYSSFLSEKSIEEAFSQAIVRLEIEYRNESTIPILIQNKDSTEIKFNDIIEQKIIKKNIKVSKTKTIIERFKNKKEETSLNYNYKDIVFFCKNLSKKYDQNDSYAIKNISITLKYGEITAIIGKNGSGKTTLLDIISAKLLPSSGSLYYPEIFISANTHSITYLHQKISFIPQELKEWRGNLKDNLHYILSSQGIYGKNNENEVDAIVEQLALKKHIHKKWNELSAGYKMRFSLAKAILEKPKLLIMDEPLANLDVGMQDIFLNDLKYIIELFNKKISIILVSHHIHEIEGISNNLILLKDGKLEISCKLKDYNKERTSNIYEMIINIPIEKFKNIMSDIVTEIKFINQKIILYTPLNVLTYDIFERCIKNKIEIKYFRDISTSTSIFLEE